MVKRYVKVHGEMIDRELEYINKHYKMNIKLGQIIKCCGFEGEVIGGNNYVWLKFGKQIRCYHPNEMELNDVNVATGEGEKDV